MPSSPPPGSAFASCRSRTTSSRSSRQDDCRYSPSGASPTYEGPLLTPRWRSPSLVKPRVHQETHQSKQGHPRISPGGTAKIIERPAEQEWRNKSTQRADTTYNTDGRTRFFGQHERDDLKD